MTRFPLAAAVFVLFIAGGCNKGPSDKQGSPGQTGGPAAVTGLKELKSTDTVVGTGPTAAKGDLVFVTYTGKLKNGSTFDSNDKPSGNPFSFTLGAGGVVEGWDKGIVGMNVGGTRKLEIPTAMAYGANPPPGSSVPPNSDLYFVVKLNDLIKQGEENTYDKTDLKVGSGPAVATGDTVTIHYEGKLVNGRRFDSTKERKKPESFIIGKGVVIKGLEAGLVGMKPGGKRRLRIPPGIGYGAYGMGVVPPNSIAILEVELLKVKKG